MNICEACGRRGAAVGCVLCRRNLCESCFDEHASRISDDMNEGFVGSEAQEAPADSVVVCEFCGERYPSARMDGHLFETHGISG